MGCYTPGVPALIKNVVLIKNVAFGTLPNANL